MTNRTTARAAQEARRAVDGLKRLWRRLHPVHRRHWRQEQLHRKIAEERLGELARTADRRFSGTVMLDGMFDNANYWMRMALVRTALGTAHAREVGVTGPYSADNCRRTFQRWGVNEVRDFDSAARPEDHTKAREEARRLIAATREADDVLCWQLPHDYPAPILYDALIKQQRHGCVQLDDPLLEDRVTEILLSIAAAWRLVEEVKPELLMCSHPVGLRYSPLVWLAVRRGATVLDPFGSFGTLRIARIRRPEGIYRCWDAPTAADLAALDDERRTRLESLGRDYIQRRTAGQTTDLAAQYAYGGARQSLTREAICRAFNWDPTKPILGVYTTTWFDYPHYMGMSHFRDLVEWVEQTAQVALHTPQYNWLFKRHPLEDWYKSATLAEFLPKTLPPHVRLAQDAWNAGDLQRALDALVTFWGTAGVEAAVQGKPVILPDQGWYHDVGFALWNRSRKEYLEQLGGPWWERLDPEQTRRKARIFAGVVFGVPEWQGGLIMEDDARQTANYPAMPELLSQNREALERELSTIRQWFDSDAECNYHTYKMMQARTYRLAAS
ncbi:MAG: hypothetical protein HQL51_04080 [Magnetococcales bacterium]|nr:hypothetical protein [Magnetococcales bacterium]